MTVSGIVSTSGIVSSITKNLTGEDIISSVIPLDNLQGWWDASATSTITESSGKVSQWVDKSSNGYIAEQLISVNQPKYISSGINNLPVIRFDVTGVQLNVNSFNIRDIVDQGTETTMFIVTNFSDLSVGSNNITLLDFRDGSTSRVLIRINKFNTPGQLKVSINDILNEINTSGVIRQTAILRARRSSNTQYSSINSSVEISGGLTNPVGNDTNIFKIGSSAGDQLDIGEIIIYNKSLTTNEIAQVEDYLNNKWNIY